MVGLAADRSCTVTRVLRFLLFTATALVFAGCGTTTKTKTVTVARVSTVEIEVPPEPAVDAIRPSPPRTSAVLPPAMLLPQAMRRPATPSTNG